MSFLYARKRRTRGIAILGRNQRRKLLINKINVEKIKNIYISCNNVLKRFQGTRRYKGLPGLIKYLESIRASPLARITSPPVSEKLIGGNTPIASS
ncbi:hypothetical protein PUN28_009585 [Cardiocondyla obscurior]|uniref:Ribosomal protein L20 n=1 Tax=Cardiocondyla obscurior TaxID=286306 RepID=A0AAW2FVA2_9HYME